MLREHELTQAAIREGMADIYVTLGMIRRSSTAVPGRISRTGMVGEELERAVMGMALTNTGAPDGRGRIPFNVQVK